MTEEEKDKSLEDLFRSKLEENEMEPGSALTARLMNRLGQREFFRFNLLRFNIYYLTAALAILMITGVILFSGSAGVTVTPPAPATGEMKAGETADPGPVSQQDAVKALAGETVMDKDPSSEERHETVVSKARPATGRESAIIPENTVAGKIDIAAAGKKSTTAAPEPLMLPVIELSVTSGCSPLPVKFAGNAGSDCLISWSFGDGGTSTDPSPEYTYNIPGRYIVTLTVTDSRGRTLTATEAIEVWGRPVAAFDIRGDNQWNEGDKVVFVNMSSGAVNYLWDFGDGTYSTLADPVYRYRQAGTYSVSLVALSAEGCADSVTVSDLFTDAGMYIRFPNAFVPNTGGPTGGYYNRRTDEESQVFHPVASGIADYNLKVYSKTGIMVFESNDTALGWDGYYRGELCAPGVYVWKVRGTYRNGEIFIMAGDVTLLKY
jgi:PKD repeat protein